MHECVNALILPKSFEDCLVVVTDTIALHGFLDGLTPHPPFQRIKDGECGVPLFGQGGGEIPSLHHLDVIFVAVNGGDALEIFGTKVGV